MEASPASFGHWGLVIRLAFWFRYSGLLLQLLQGPADVLDHAVLDGQFDQCAAVVTAAEDFDEQLGQCGFELLDLFVVTWGWSCGCHANMYT